MLRDEIHRRAERAAHQLAVLLDNIFVPFSERESTGGATHSDNEERITHGRHCICTPCAAQDWSEPGLAPCGMHGPSCPPMYQPLGGAGTYVRPDSGETE